MPLCESTFSNLLLKQTSPVEKARLLSAASAHASDWLNALPVASLGLKMDNNTFRVALSLRLGAKLFQAHKCVCGLLVDPFGHHGLSCKNAKGTCSRHAHANDIIKRSLATAGVPSIVEPPGLSRGDGKRPDSLTLFPWSGGKSVVWDFTCRDTLAQSYVGETSLEAGKAAEKAEDFKMDLYSNLIRDYTVVPVAGETLGAWGKQGLKFIQEIGSRITMATGKKNATYYLFQSLSMAIQRGNVASILGTSPKIEFLDEIYNL